MKKFQPLAIDDGEDSFPLAPTAAADAGSPYSVNGAAKPVATIPQLADYLINGFWQYNSTISHRWGTSTISYNISGLNASEQMLAQSALNAWHEVANLTFVQTSGAANIAFTHNGTMTAYETDSYSGSGILSAATINISADWITNDGGAYDGRTGIDSYGYQTYVHEIGHTLGLGHQGPYNGSASYSTNAIYANDTWQYSIMSYFAQSSYDRGSYRYVLTPQMADIFAIQQIYGANSNTRTGDTIYGFHSNAGPVFDFELFTQVPALTIYDSGGRDTLDASGYSQSQVIDLTPGSFSSLGGLVHNIGISTDTIIENAMGGSGNDQLIGNVYANIFDGGRGNDTLTGVAEGFHWALNGSATFLGDFSGDGQADIVQIERSGNIVGALSTGHAFGTVSDWSNGARPGDQVADVNGDGRADLIEPNENGNIYVWTSTGSSLNHYAVWGHGSRPGDQLADVNGDGRVDLIESHENGNVYVWTSTGSSFNHYAVWGRGSRPGDQLADVNGDGCADLIETNENGNIYVWTSTGSSFNHYAVWGRGSRPGDQLADVNGDGCADLIETNENGNIYVWTSTGSGFNNYAVWGHGSRPHDRLADVNGDGRSDLIELNENGNAYVWISTGNSFSNYSVWATGIGPSGRLADFNGDGRSDILDLDQNGNGRVWLSNGSGFDANSVWSASTGNDTFVFNANFGHDIVTDFQPGSADVIQFDHTVFSDFSSVLSHATDDGHGNAIIAYDSNDTLTLQQVTRAALIAGDFHFV